MTRRSSWLVVMALSVLVAFAISETRAGKKKPKPPAPPADPAIAYVMGTSRGTEDDSLWVMNADGSNQTRIYQSSGNVWGPPAWSGDGARIAFTVQLDLWRIDVAVIDGTVQGSNPIRLVADLDVNHPAWSPVADTVAFVAQTKPQGWQLRTIPAGGGAHQTLYTTVTGRLDYPTWSPDGTRIAFFEEVAHHEQVIRILRIATGAVETVAPTVPPDHVRMWGLDWGRTKDVLAYCSRHKVYRKPNKLDFVETVYTLDLVTGETTEVTRGEFPSWSPDDRKLALSGIVTHELGTGQTEELSTGARYPAWRR